MNLVKFQEVNVVLATDQAEYIALPAHRHATDPHGVVTSCWQLSFRERLKLLLTGKLWHQTMTFRKLYQPQLLTVNKPKLN